jgi:hypothetical protein
MDTVEMQKFKIDISNLFKKFNDHLNIQNNSRILFSGKFGIGKTYFLNEFFEDHEKDYEIFHLFPVNYQISSSENIISFLKRDILTELIIKDKIFDDKDDLDKSFIDFIKNEWDTTSVLKGVIENSIELLPFGLGKLGKPLKTALEIDKKFQDFKYVANNTLNTFLEKNNSETDIISEIIKNKIEKIENKKQSVLILDDLDRLDPEHIFKLLNTFSAFFEQSNGNENKFGFDKIILVADSRNIKSIFHHKYGKDTDFNGYFDKFFSLEIFQFNNDDIVKNLIDQIISKFQTTDQNNLKELLLSESGLLKIFLKGILIKSVKLSGKERLNLRQLLKGIDFQFEALKSGSYNDMLTQTNNQITHQLVNIGIKVLISIFGGSPNDLLYTLQKIKSEIKNNSKNEIPLSMRFLKFLLFKISPFDMTMKDMEHHWLNYIIEFKGGQIVKIKNGKNTSITTDFLFFDLLIVYIKEKYYLKEVEPY